MILRDPDIAKYVLFGINILMKKRMAKVCLMIVSSNTNKI